MIPYLQNKSFIGRQKKLQELEDRLLVNQETRQLAIYGLGGVGMIQLALAFWNIVPTKYPDYSIFWVSTLNNAQFKQDYTQIAKKCFIATESSEAELVSIVREYLRSEEAGKWLLIVDNADEKLDLLDPSSGVLNYLPSNETGLLLFTTRYKEIAVNAAEKNITVFGRDGAD